MSCPLQLYTCMPLTCLPTPSWASIHTWKEPAITVLQTDGQGPHNCQSAHSSFSPLLLALVSTIICVCETSLCRYTSTYSCSPWSSVCIPLDPVTTTVCAGQLPLNLEVLMRTPPTLVVSMDLLQHSPRTMQLLMLWTPVA